MIVKFKSIEEMEQVYKKSGILDRLKKDFTAWKKYDEEYAGKSFLVDRIISSESQVRPWRECFPNRWFYIEKIGDAYPEELFTGLEEKLDVLLNEQS